MSKTVAVSVRTNMTQLKKTLESFANLKGKESWHWDFVVNGDQHSEQKTAIVKEWAAEHKLVARVRTLGGVVSPEMQMYRAMRESFHDRRVKTDLVVHLTDGDDVVSTLLDNFAKEDSFKGDEPYTLGGQYRGGDVPDVPNWGTTRAHWDKTFRSDPKVTVHSFITTGTEVSVPTEDDGKSKSQNKNGGVANE